MTSDRLHSMYQNVCEAPNGNGFRIEHMPDFLLEDSFDDSAPHVHSFYEILWFQEGNGIHTVDFVEYEVKPNTMFFLSPGQIHHFDRNQDYRGIAIKMCTDFMRDGDSTNSLFLKYNAFYTFDTEACCYLDNDTAKVLGELVFQMEQESLCSGEFGNVDILKALLRIFLVKIHRHGILDGGSRMDNLKPAHQLFVKFRRLVEQEYTRLHTVQEYADALNVAVRTLNKCVNECSHMSPLAFINTRIILEAKRMVRYTNLMIKEIAYDLGYEDPSYFVKLFKRQTGYLPSEFRELDQVTHCKTLV